MALSRQLPVFVYTFGPYFTVGQKVKLRLLLEGLFRYHINTIQTVDGPYRAIQKDGTISGHKEDYINQEKLLQESGCNWVYGYGVYARFKSELKSRHIDGTITNPKMQELFRQWISNWVKYLKEEQVDLNKFLIPLCDEPAKPIIDELLIASRIIHEIEPRLKITCTIPTWSTLEDVKKLSPAIDVWIPWEPRITTRCEAAAELEYPRVRALGDGARAADVADLRLSRDAVSETVAIAGGSPSAAGPPERRAPVCSCGRCGRGTGVRGEERTGPSRRCGSRMRTARSP
jgi:hypothetical protein